jgi:hypothetical protein
MKTLLLLVSLGPVYGAGFLIVGIGVIAAWYVGYQVFSQLEGEGGIPWPINCFGATGAVFVLIGLLNLI